jgi:hypothetical protein
MKLFFELKGGHQRFTYSLRKIRGVSLPGLLLASEEFIANKKGVIENLGMAQL